MNKHTKQNVDFMKFEFNVNQVSRGNINKINSVYENRNQSAKRVDRETLEKRK